jgi:hypothetical protein
MEGFQLKIRESWNYKFSLNATENWNQRFVKKNQEPESISP